MVSLRVTINYCRELNHLMNIVLYHCYIFIFKSQLSFYSFHSYANVSWKYIVWKKSCSEYIVSYISINFGGEKIWTSHTCKYWMVSLHLIMQVNNEWWFYFYLLIPPHTTLIFKKYILSIREKYDCFLRQLMNLDPHLNTQALGKAQSNLTCNGSVMQGIPTRKQYVCTVWSCSTMA